MIDTAVLKNKILELALTGQILNSGKDANPLFDSVVASAYKTDKTKVPDKNYDLSELSFQIPYNWKWVWLGDIFQHNTGKALNSSNTEGISLEYITTSNLYWDRFELEDLKTMLFKESEIEKCTVKKGDLLVCEGGDIGRAAIWSENYETRIQNHIHRLRPYVDEISVRFYYYVMMYYKNKGFINGRGIGLQGLSSKRLHTILVPFPDFETQCLIAEKIDELFKVIDTIEKLQLQYSSNLEVLKSKIIDAGIQGKLTEQLPEDGTAEELLEQIAKEKKQLIKEKKVKGTKALPEITEDEIPFEIPDNWKWVCLDDTGILQTGATPPKTNPDFFGNDIPFLSPGEIQDNTIVTYDNQGLSILGIEKARVVDANSVLQVCIGGSIGKAAINDRKVTFNQQINSVTPILCEAKYLLYCMVSSYFMGKIQTASSGAATPIINKSKWGELLIPLPPLAEQKRIVEKVVEMLTLL